MSQAGCRACVDFPKIAQAKEIHIRARIPIHMQLDGEAWWQEPAEGSGETLITITRDVSSSMFYPKGKTHSACAVCTCH